ncbi:uncharacterized protein LOC130549094 [Triplophysa rosa]|uniref:uncharacterized protein LOC130549094 n=1 Tax=Triplophysa rosa TaxID=992332 RepID=UPI002545F448|nr:uncharacterized protein LOC130549094 [Triplophysa rosa]
MAHCARLGIPPTGYRPGGLRPGHRDPGGFSSFHGKRADLAPPTGLQGKRQRRASWEMSADSSGAELVTPPAATSQPATGHVVRLKKKRQWRGARDPAQPVQPASQPVSTPVSSPVQPVSSPVQPVSSPVSSLMSSAAGDPTGVPAGDPTGAQSGAAGVQSGVQSGILPNVQSCAQPHAAGIQPGAAGVKSGIQPGATGVQSGATGVPASVPAGAAAGLPAGLPAGVKPCPAGRQPSRPQPSLWGLHPRERPQGLRLFPHVPTPLDSPLWTSPYEPLSCPTPLPCLLFLMSYPNPVVVLSCLPLILFSLFCLVLSVTQSVLSCKYTPCSLKGGLLSRLCLILSWFSWSCGRVFLYPVLACCSYPVSCLVPVAAPAPRLVFVFVVYIILII